MGMLVLDRLQGESIVATVRGVEITITYLKPKRGGRMGVIGVSAPREVVVDRQEVHERKKREAALAAAESATVEG